MIIPAISGQGGGWTKWEGNFYEVDLLGEEDTGTTGNFSPFAGQRISEFQLISEG